MSLFSEKQEYSDCFLEGQGITGLLCPSEPARNMRRFYRLDVQPDLFGGVLLVKQWGRIGAQGRITVEHYASEAPALDALQRQAERKRRRGYGEILSAPDI